MPPKSKNRKHVRFEDQPAVAEERSSKGSSWRPIAFADDDGDDESDAGRWSTTGDTVGSDPDDSNGEPAVADDRFDWPKTPVQGNPGASTKRGRSSKNNNQREVGNFGLMVGNWGKMAKVGGKKKKIAIARRDCADRQIKKSPAQVLVIAESSMALRNLLEQPPEQGSAFSGLDSRPTHEHWVQRGNEESCILIAARKDIAHYVTCMHHEVNEDHPYTKEGKKNMARTGLMVCKVQFKQNIGHLGKDIIVCGVHGHNLTMNVKWPKVWMTFWNRLAAYVKKFGIQFLAGDFNMSLTEVCKQLRSREISCDCVAWYPWQRPKATVAGDDEQRLGIDSMGIFYIGQGSNRYVEIRTTWTLRDIDDLTAVAGDNEKLDTYAGENVPGQPWGKYRCGKKKSKKKMLT